MKVDVHRYMHVRNELVRLHGEITQNTFSVYMPLSQFMTLKTMQRLEANPPLCGLEYLSEITERPLSILSIAQAFHMVGSDDAVLYFKNAREDVPVIYNTIQDYIMYWLEVRKNNGWLNVATMEELGVLEKVAKYIFGWYREFHMQEINQTMTPKSVGEFSLLDYLKGTIMYGDRPGEDISFISHLDEYLSDTGGIQAPSMTGGSADLIKDLMRFRSTTGMGG